MSEDEKELACENCGRTHFGESPCVNKDRAGLIRCSPCASSYHDGVRQAVERLLDTTDMDKLIKLRARVEARIRSLAPPSGRFLLKSVPHDKKLSAIRPLRHMTGLGLKGAHNLVTNWPSEFVAVRDADSCVKELRDLGCVVETMP